MKELILTTLDALAEKIESQFNTKVLRKMYILKNNPMYRSVYPIENSFLTGKENNLFGPFFKKLYTFDDNDASGVGILLVPTTDKDEIIENKLITSGKDLQDVFLYLSNIISIVTYDGGFIKMSYAITSGTDTNGIYATPDTLVSEDIYQNIGSVKYRRILFYL